jgi:hypothetical protein
VLGIFNPLDVLPTGTNGYRDLQLLIATPAGKSVDSMTRTPHPFMPEGGVAEVFPKRSKTGGPR